jgi:phosphopantetheinyl transferase
MSLQDLTSATSSHASSPGYQGVRGVGRSDCIELWLASPQAADRCDVNRLTPAEQDRLRSLRTSTARRDFMVSRALQQHVGHCASTSLTHSASYAALASAPADCDIGVDLERHRSRNVASLARFAFSPDEHAALISLDDARRVERFYTLWVMKEALAKALRLALLEALRHCTFLEDAGGWRGYVPTTRRWQVRAFEPYAGFSLAVASVGAALPGRIEMFEWPQGGKASWKTLAIVASPTGL